MTNDVLSSLRQQLGAGKQDYLLLEPVTRERARLQFSGPFEGSEVVWDATLYTLTGYAKHHPESLAGGLRNFIDIAATGDSPIPITIGLGVRQINPATIQMAIRMVRQYKRLQRGWHEYGEVWGLE